MCGHGPIAAEGDKPAAPSWEHFAHDADIGVRGRGITPAEAFAQAALAMTAVITDPKDISPSDAVAIECEASSLDLLFYKWLNALVFEMATRGLLFGAFEVSVEGTRLTAIAHGEKVDRARHAPAVEVKGATLTELKVEHEPSGWWLAQCVVDV
ncbi:MAG: archease [Hyphomicrobiaceae bacterium]|nr:MAG: archease [Hyphomicrobiaceae bacterium]